MVIGLILIYRGGGIGRLEAVVVKEKGRVGVGVGGLDERGRDL
jgi:hypothetical protein